MSLLANRVQEHLQGVAVGLLTPFDKSREINHSELAENAHDLYDEGIQTFLTTANISEYHSLSQQERIDSAKTVVESLPDDACVLACESPSKYSVMAELLAPVMATPRVSSPVSTTTRTASRLSRWR